VSESDYLDEALVRLHHTGPEFQGRLSNHGPMVVEALVRRGHGDEVDRWVSWYSTRLDELPGPRDVITEDTWMDSLGDVQRLGDWVAFFNEEFKLVSWNDALVKWWPRLLPGLAASATHSVIRVGHAVRALRDEGSSEVRIEELAQALAYWAARWLPIPIATRPPGSLDVRGALGGLPRLADDDARFPELVSRLGALPPWPTAVAALQAPTDAQDAQRVLRDIVTEATLYYGSRERGDEIMVVHAATAPNAVLRVLPSLPTDLWVQSQRAAWMATAAVVTMYDSPIPPNDTQRAPVRTAEETFARAVEHRDEHVIKFADTALDVYGWTSNERALVATQRAAADITG